MNRYDVMLLIVIIILAAIFIVPYILSYFEGCPIYHKTYGNLSFTVRCDVIETWCEFHNCTKSWGSCGIPVCICDEDPFELLRSRF